MIKIILLLFLSVTGFSLVGQDNEQIVRMAKLQIDSTQLAAYKAALQTEIETSIRIEPGVLMLNAVAEKDDPTQITIMEIYANEDAYNSHLETPHFKRYKNDTQKMVKSLELVDVKPIKIAMKPN